MRYFSTVVAFVAVAGLSAPAVAQQASEPQAPGTPAAGIAAGDLREFEDMEVPRLGISVDELEDMDVVGPDGEQIGEVEQVLIDRDDRIVAVAVEAGGFLGIGDHEAILGIDQLALASDRDQLVISMTAEELRSLPEWDD